MLGDKPSYNPDEYNDDLNQTEEEKKASEDKKAELMVKLRAKAEALKEAPAQVYLRKIKEKFRRGLGMHQAKPENAAAKSNRPDKEDVAAEEEKSGESLNRKIKNLLNRYKFKGTFSVRMSEKTRGNYVFKLLENYKTILQFDDRIENIEPRLLEYFENKS